MNLAKTTVWKRYQPSQTAPWDLKRVVHLHRRAGFAANWSQIQQDIQAGPDKAIDGLLEGGISSDEFETLSVTIGSAAANSKNPQRLKAWWLLRMLKSHDSLAERLTLMWHNHFATSNRKVRSLTLMHGQNQRLRKHCRSPFGELLSAVIKHPAMLFWLDADTNRKGRSNENLARELLELFTLGIGNFSERDVKESARALTGWTVINDRFENRPSRHDDAELTILGKKQPFDGDELLEHLVGHPATARRIAWRICQAFMGDEFLKSDEAELALEELATGMIENGLNVRGTLDTIFRSELFFSKENMSAKILGPTELLIGSIRCLELEQHAPSTMILAQWVARMGQDLFYPPNVGGWKSGRSWLNSRTVVARSNFAKSLVDGSLWHPQESLELNELFAKYSVPNDLESRVAWLTQLLWGMTNEKVVDEVVATVRTVAKRPENTALAILMSRAEHQLA